MNADTDCRILTKAVIKAAERLDLLNRLPDILGIDAAAFEGMIHGTSTLDPTRNEWNAATRFVRLFRCLIALVGDPQRAREWLDTPHQVLGKAPIELLPTTEGYDPVLRYLDAVQKYEIKLPPRARQH